VPSTAALQPSVNDPRSSTHGERFAFVVFAVLCLALVAVEVPCALLAYHTLNADACAAQLVFVGLANLIPAVLFFLGGLRYSALSVALVIAFVIVPYDLALGWRMLQVQEEASDIVGWGLPAEARHRPLSGHPGRLQVQPAGVAEVLRGLLGGGALDLPRVLRRLGARPPRLWGSLGLQRRLRLRPHSGAA
jgi:hypothetical protein